MDNKEYLKRLFGERKVILALVITAAACVLSFLCAKYLPGKTAQSVGQVVCALLMFSQLLVVGKTANRVAAELEAEEQQRKSAGKKNKKKK